MPLANPFGALPALRAGGLVRAAAHEQRDEAERAPRSSSITTCLVGDMSIAKPPDVDRIPVRQLVLAHQDPS